MSQVKATRTVTQIASELKEFALEPYVVGPAGIGVLRLDVSEEVSAYVSFAYFTKYRAVGAYVGFAFPALKAITDECLLAAGRQLGVVPQHAMANPCPAVLFPLEFFLRSPEAQPFKIDGPAAEWARKVIYRNVLLGAYARLKERRELVEFLAADKSPFSWAAAEVPRRLVHVVYLARELGAPLEVAARLLVPVTRALPGDADFDGCDGGDLVDAVVRHFYRGVASGPCLQS
jgi:hypothetical protein